jgi:site-specific recombinase XerD
MSEQVPTSSIAYHNFINTCRSAMTQKSYQKSLEYFMKFLKVDNWDNLLELDPKIIQRNICDYIMFMRSKDLAPKSIGLYVAAIRKFYDMNDIITLNWKKIHSFEPEPESRSEDRPYTHQEIATLMKKASPRDRCVILLMASSGTAKLRSLITKRGTLEILIPLCCTTNPVRHKQFRQALKGFSTRTLSIRLKELEKAEY